MKDMDLNKAFDFIVNKIEDGVRANVRKKIYGNQEEDHRILT